MKRRRCLIPANGYYEWQAAGMRKRPHFIHRRDGGPIGLAGLAETWIGPNGEELDTVAIVTAPASADLAVLHHRVPVTIAPEDFERWLDCRANDAETALALLTAPGEGEFVWHEVSTRVNRTANDDAQLILPITAEEMAAEDEKARPAKKAAPRKPAPVASDDGQGALAAPGRLARRCRGKKEVKLLGPGAGVGERSEFFPCRAEPITGLLFRLGADPQLRGLVIQQAGHSFDQEVVVAIGIGRKAKLPHQHHRALCQIVEQQRRGVAAIEEIAVLGLPLPV